ncbi:uncharacterized protein LOC142350327 isoform X2 [Convolutriloba macropyga]|uniref:uncharacterized protein LOC142350327 isoform X2 n=1 Tax=Convolutriloba macropyga TaxID=536237 RepID=UPI003F527852
MLTLYEGKDKKLYWKKNSSYVYTDEMEREQDRIARGILSQILRERQMGEQQQGEDDKKDVTVVDAKEPKETTTDPNEEKQKSEVEKQKRMILKLQESSDEAELDDEDEENDVKNELPISDDERITGKKAIGQVRKINLKPRIKREPPVIRYPLIKVKTKNLLEQFGIGDVRGDRQILLPSKKKVQIQNLVPLHLMASAKAFKALQESEEWKKMRTAMNERFEGSTQHYDVTDQYEVRCGAYQICTKCADIRTKPPRISSIYKTGKEKNAQIGNSLYDTWANSLKELNPYLEMRDKATKRKQKEMEQKQEVQNQEDKSDQPKNENLDFNDVYAYLNEAMNKIETSSEKTKRRLASSKGSSQKFKPGPIVEEGPGSSQMLDQMLDQVTDSSQADASEDK